MAAPTDPLARVFGSSQVSGSLVPQHVSPMVPSVWSVTHAPSANTVATVTQASPGAGLKNVVTGLTVILAAGASAPSAITVTAHLRDGASGVGTPKKSWAMSIPAVAGSMNGVVRNQMWIEMTAATQTTLEFSVAGGSNTVESVEMDGGVIAA